MEIRLAAKVVIGKHQCAGENEHEFLFSHVLEGDSFARSSDRFAQFDDSSVMSEFGIENKNKNSLSQVTEVVI